MFIVASVFLAPYLMGCGGEDASKDDASAKTQKEEPVADAPDGEKIFRTYCVTCHGIDGKMGLNGAKDLGLATTTVEERIEQVTNGKGLMTAFEGILTPEEIEAVAQYTLQFKTE
ncbi:MAG: c-type cytochrome [Saprospiraceae bacterium]|nr:c-type cytochrome [Saprospiraceae bacterium]